MVSRPYGDTPMSNRAQIPLEQEIVDRIDVLVKAQGISRAAMLRRWILDRLVIEERENV